MFGKGLGLQCVPFKVTSLRIPHQTGNKYSAGLLEWYFDCCIGNKVP